MSNTPTEFSTVPDGEPSIPKAAACSSEGVDMVIKGKQLEPSFLAIQHDIEQRRERIARKLEP